MSAKTEAKKSLIIEKATKLFANKGYLSVTMSDIREACDISRGGLYMYYSSVEEIFKDVMASMEATDAEDLDNATAWDLLQMFLLEQKREIIKKGDNLNLAIYEYEFTLKAAGKNAEAKKRFNTAKAVLEGILKKGNKSGEFACKNPTQIASNMMYTIEGMKIMSRINPISADGVDDELYCMLSRFMNIKY